MDQACSEISESSSVNDAAWRCRNVAAIVVTYKPDLEILFRGLNAIACQVGQVIIVDNASNMIPIDQIEGMARNAGIEARVIVMPRNEGLGAAINAGIGEARAGGYPFVIMFDQDSVPEAGMVARLEQAYLGLDGDGGRIGAVGPRFRAPESGSLSEFSAFFRGRVRRVRCNGSEGTVEAGFLISSGSLIAMKAIDAIGGMDESLFIDHVDTEWCLRARAKGWSIYGVCGAIMEHSLGEHRQRFWLFRWRNISLHAPFRYYYIFRNSLLLRKRDDLPWDCSRAMLKRDVMLAIYLLFVPMNWRKNMKMIWRGLADGVRGISGPMSHR